MENIEKHNKGYPVFSPLRENDCYHFSFFFSGFVLFTKNMYLFSKLGSY